MKRGKVLKTGTPEEVFGGESFENLSTPLIASLKGALNKNGVEINCKLTADDFIEAVSKEFENRNKK
jgi:hypothetical protein